MDPELIAEAHAAIAQGADPQQVAARFREISGHDLPSPAVAAGQIEPPHKQYSEPADVLKMQGSPANPSGKGQGDFATRTIADLMSPTNLAIGAASMAIPVAGPLSSLLLGGGTGAALGAANAAEAAPAGRRVQAAKDAAIPAGLLGLLTAGGGELVGAGVKSLRAPNAVRALAEDVRNLRLGLGKAEGSAAEQAAAAQREYGYRTGKSDLPGADAFGIDAAHEALKGSVNEEAALRQKWLEQGIAEAEKTAAEGAANQTAGAQELERIRRAALGDVSGAMQAGAEEQAAAKLRDLEQNAGPVAAAKIKQITGFNEPLDVLKGKVRQGKQEVSELRYSPIDERGVVESPKIKEFLSMPEIARDVRAVGIKPGEAPEFSQLQALRNRFRTGPNKDRDMFGQINRLMQKDISGLASGGAEISSIQALPGGADPAYAQLSGMGRQQAAAMKAKNWTAAQIRDHLSLLSQPEQQAFTEAYVQHNLIDDILKKNTGAPALGSKLGGGPQMDERLQAILPSDQFQQVKQIVADHQAAIDAINREKNIALARLGTQQERGAQDIGEMARTAAEKAAANKASRMSELAQQKGERLSEIQQQKSASLSKLDASRDAAMQQAQAQLAEGQAPLERIRGLKSKVDVLAETQKALQEQADKTASRLKNALKAGALVGAGWEARHLIGAALP